MLRLTPKETSELVGRVAMRIAATLVVLAAPRVTSAQLVWNDSTTRALVELATRLRAAQLADSGLADYRAGAHGCLTFLAQVGQGFTEPPRSEEHTSELQSHVNLVCRLLLEKKNKK